MPQNGLAAGEAEAAAPAAGPAAAAVGAPSTSVKPQAASVWCASAGESEAWGGKGAPPPPPPPPLARSAALSCATAPVKKKCCVATQSTGDANWKLSSSMTSVRA